MGVLNIPIIHARRVLSIAGQRIFLRKFCQNLQNAQFFRPKTGILPAILPSAAGQNFDTFSILHTVERGESLQGRGNFTPSVKTCRFCQLPRGGSLWRDRKLCGLTGKLLFVEGCSLLTPKENQKSASDFDALEPRKRGCSPLLTPKKRATPEKTEDSRLFGVKIF